MIGTIFVLTPMVGWAWPAVAPIVTAAAAALGYKQMVDKGPPDLLRSRLTKRLENMRRETVALDSVLTEVISEDLGTDERMVFERDDFLLVFRKDTRGKFFVDVSGKRSVSGLNLKLRGEEFARELIQKFAYNKMIEQIERRGATVIQEEVKEDGRIVIRSRQWR